MGALRLLLDTHILLWWLGENPRLSEEQRRALSCIDPAQPAYVSDISLWEIATLVSLGRISLKIPLRDFLEQAVAAPLVRRVSITPRVAAEVAALPDSFHRDPADRILVATARVLDLSLLTQDRRILESSLARTIG